MSGHRRRPVSRYTAEEQALDRIGRDVSIFRRYIDKFSKLFMKISFLQFQFLQK